MFLYYCKMKIDEAIRSKFESNIHRAIVNLLYTHAIIRDDQIDLLKPYGILPQHYNVMRIIKGKHPKAVSPGEVRDVMLDKGNDLTRLLDKLVALNWVNRKLCDTNRRKIDLTLSEKGIEMLEQLNKTMLAQRNKYAERLSAEEAQQLSDLLDKLRD